MPTYFLDTLRRSARRPALWSLVGLGLALGWAGLHLGVLALGDDPRRTAALVLSTGQATAALLGLWCLGRTLGEDASAELAVAADCTAPGRAGRFLGRSLGAWALASAGGILVGLVTSAGAASDASDLSMYFAIIVSGALIVGWGACLAALGGAALVLPGGLVLWLAGHLPWGGEALLPGPVGRILHALLPGPIFADTLKGRVPSVALVVLGLTVLVIAQTAFPPGRLAPGRRIADAG